jgi:hypothetical protein
LPIGRESEGNNDEMPRMTTVIDFDAPDLAAQIEELSQYDLDRLPFGAILGCAFGVWRGVRARKVSP